MLHFPKEVFNLKKLLIVEDEPDIQELLEAYLHDAGYETTIAGDGVEALAKFQKDKFDLILLDFPYHGKPLDFLEFESFFESLSS